MAKMEPRWRSWSQDRANTALSWSQDGQVGAKMEPTWRQREAVSSLNSARSPPPRTPPPKLKPCGCFLIGTARPGKARAFRNSRHVSCVSSSRHLSCLSNRHLSCLNSRHQSCLSRRHLSCLNNTLFLCQKQAKAPTHAIAMELDDRTVTFQTDHTPQDRIAVRFEWALPFGELLKNRKTKMAMGSICQIMDKAQIGESGRNWAQNGRQGLSRKPRASNRA